MLALWVLVRRFPVLILLFGAFLAACAYHSGTQLHSNLQKGSHHAHSARR